MSDFSIFMDSDPNGNIDSDINRAKTIITEALSRYKYSPPVTKTELISWFDIQFDVTKVIEFSKIIATEGRASFDSFVFETAVESGLYLWNV